MPPRGSNRPSAGPGLPFDSNNTRCEMALCRRYRQAVQAGTVEGVVAESALQGHTGDKLRYPLRSDVAGQLDEPISQIARPFWLRVNQIQRQCGRVAAHIKHQLVGRYQGCARLQVGGAPVELPIKQVLFFPRSYIDNGGSQVK